MEIGFIRKRDSYSFAQLLKGFQEAVSSAQEMLEMQQLNNFSKYFDAEGMVLTKKINPGTGRELTVPILSIIPHNTLVMEDVEIEFDTSLKAVTPKTAGDGQLAELVENTEVEFGMNSKNTSDLVHVKVRFKSTSTPEGLSCVIDECNKII